MGQVGVVLVGKGYQYIIVTVILMKEQAFFGRLSPLFHKFIGSSLS
jgi:hypothetical protein